MRPEFKRELQHLSSHPDDLLRLSEFDIRNNLMKLFHELGWNTFNDGLSPLDYEVLQEASIRNGRPDLTFQLDGSKKFYIETKKATVEMGAKDIWQTWKYAWNSGLPFSVLSNFLKIWLIDCRATPPQEAPKDWRTLVVKEWELPRYQAEFDDLKSWLGKSAVKGGSLSALESMLESAAGAQPAIAATLFPLKGAQPVDLLFLNQLDLWRLKIAGNLYSRNIDTAQITGLTDQVINFVVFVRFLEDRGLLPEETLKEIMTRGIEKKGTLARELNALRSQLNALYNGTVFKETRTGFNIDEPILMDIIHSLYAPQSPYLFDYISVDVLGTIYERFLGKKLLFRGKQVRYRDEKESKQTRKEGGVFYTERYITTFMVNQALRRILDREHPERIFELKMADIACGSGSFLIMVYRTLLFWFENICKERDDLKERYLERLPDGSWKLKIDHKIRLLERCIHGVDIDPEAVDVTKFSLYLQLLESETEKGIREFFNRARKPVLPILDKNIKRGNSLVDYSIAVDALFDERAEEIIQPFDLKEFFSEVFEAGGFDMVVGNPPYSAKLHDLEKRFCRRYDLAKGNFNSANLFIGRVDQLVKPSGAWMLIVPKSLIYSDKWTTTRKKLSPRLFLAVDASKAFRDVKLEQVIVGCSGKRLRDNILTGTITKAETTLFEGPRQLSFTDITPTNLPLHEIAIGEKITRKSVSLGEYFRLLRGTVPQAALRETGERKVYRGKFVQGYHLLTPELGISEEEAQKHRNLLTPKLMFQQIVSHAMKPSPHVRLVGAADMNGTALSSDTVSNLFIKRHIPGTSDSEALLLALAVLNSRVTSWFTDRFIYGRAIRTMHFDNYHVRKMRFPSDITHPSIPVITNLTSRLIATDIHSPTFKEKSKEMEKLINGHVALLFGLTEEDVEVIDENFGDEYLCNMGMLRQVRDDED